MMKLTLSRVYACMFKYGPTYILFGFLGHLPLNLHTNILIVYSGCNCFCRKIEAIIGADVTAELKSIAKKVRNCTNSSFTCTGYNLKGISDEWGFKLATIHPHSFTFVGICQKCQPNKNHQCVCYTTHTDCRMNWTLNTKIIRLEYDKNILVQMGMNNILVLSIHPHLSVRSSRH